MGLLETRVVIAQINPTVGDLKGNAEKIHKYIEKAIKLKANIVIFPELTITGYPPQDLVLEKKFIESNRQILENLTPICKDIYAVIGFIDYDGQHRYNAAATLGDKKIIGVTHKTLLPTYDVFDEDRYFTPANSIEPIMLDINGRNIKVGIEICEDLWDDNYKKKVTRELVEKGAEIIINLSASPFYVGKRTERENLLKTHSRRNHVPVFYVNMVGGQDELVFDGFSMAFDSEGKLLAFGKHFEEDFVSVDIDMENQGVGTEVAPPKYIKKEETFKALVLGTRDYCKKTGFRKAVIGLSGGIDSSLTASIATEALGKDNILGVSMPSQYSSEHSKEDAELLAKNLGIRYTVVPIEGIFEAFKGVLAKQFKDNAEGVTEENLQARIRGTILMALSNKFGHIVFTTGNKTELALGYCTLYGDMAGGLGIISDLSKVQVYELAEYYNSLKDQLIIPKRVLDKKPSAELKKDQYDPFDYSVVSPLVDEIVENGKNRDELIELGYAQTLVEEILTRIRSAEYKRKQTPPGIKITSKAFGIGRKMPIVNKYF